MGASDKFKGENAPAKGGGVRLSTCCPSPCEETRREVKRTIERVFGWWTLWHIKYFKEKPICLFVKVLWKMRSHFQSAISGKLQEKLVIFIRVSQIFTLCWCLSVDMSIFQFFYRLERSTDRQINSLSTCWQMDRWDFVSQITKSAVCCLLICQFFLKNRQIDRLTDPTLVDKSTNLTFFDRS